MPYGVVRGLFEKLVVRKLFEKLVVRAPDVERNVLLADAAGLAAPVLGVAVGEGGLIPDSAGFAGLHGLYWLTANLAERAPLLLAVDDAHWADEASLRFLIYLRRRIEALPILLVVAARPAEPGVEAVLLEPLRNDPLARVLHPAPLSEAAGSLIVRAARAVPSLPGRDRWQPAAAAHAVPRAARRGR